LHRWRSGIESTPVIVGLNPARVKGFQGKESNADVPNWIKLLCLCWYWKIEALAKKWKI
jgi:hypothetical protein